MPLVKRRAYFEFLNKNTCRIVTTTRSADFLLDGPCAVDLVNLKKVDGDYDPADLKFNFVAIFMHDEALDFYSVRVFVMTNSYHDYEQVEEGETDINNNKKAVYANVWMD